LFESSFRVREPKLTTVISLAEVRGVQPAVTSSLSSSSTATELRVAEYVPTAELKELAQSTIDIVTTKVCLAFGAISTLNQSNVATQAAKLEPET
jgi:hypothetical protein